LSVFRKSVEKITVSLNFDKNDGSLPEDQHAFIITSRSFLLIMRKVSDKHCR